MAAPRFFICPKCGNFIELYKEGTCPVMCCGQAMKELKGNTSDGATEKHVPVATINGDILTVQVGSVEHPMDLCTDRNWLPTESFESR